MGEQGRKTDVRADAWKVFGVIEFAECVDAGGAAEPEGGAA